MIETSIVQTSLSTVMMAVFTTNVFLVLLALCLVNQKLLVCAGYKLLALFVIFTTLRFVLPIELPFTVTLKLPVLMSQIIAKCHTRLFQFGEQPISLWVTFKAIWLVGFLIGFMIHLFSYYRTSKLITLYGKELTNTEPYREILSAICREKEHSNPFRVIELPGLDVPALFGIIRPKILVPENFNLSRQQLTYILRHEVTHHFNHDILLKNIIKIITLAYWWDIFSWLLNHQTDVILEMRIDNSLTRADADVTREYMECLIDISDRASEKRILPRSMTIGILPSGYKDLKRRFLLMINNQTKPNIAWTVLLLIISSAVYMLSYTLIWEGYIPPAEVITGDLLPIEGYDINSLMFPSAENSYFIDNRDGTYEFYLNGKKMETTSSLDYYPDGIPIYTMDTAP